MKSVVINAGPKMKDANAQFAKSAMEGSKSSGAEVEYVDLYRLDLSGCRACLICKNDEETCKCYWRDDLSPLIDDIFNADVLLISVPVFFSHPSSHYLALLERLIYSAYVTNKGMKLKGKIDIGLFYTINYPRDYFEKSVRPHFKLSEEMLKMLNGKVVIESFPTISKYSYENKSEEEIESREKQLALDMQRAFEIGAELSR